MNEDLTLLFAKVPGALPLYEEFEQKLCSSFDVVEIQVKKTQVTFKNRYGFAWAWPPWRKMKGWPDVFLGVTFGLGYHLEHPRIVEAVEPYPHRWTHHMLVQRPEEIDDELMGWIREAYDFSMVK